MKKKVKILIGVSVAVLLVAILTITLVIVLRKEEWIVLEKSFSSLNEQCTPDWSGNSDWRRKRCKMPLICAATGDQKTGNTDEGSRSPNEVTCANCGRFTL